MPPTDYPTAADPYLPFFVYGTLLPGEVNYWLWREAIEEIRPALISPARLYDMGQYPMLVDAAAGEVRGMVANVRPSSYPVALAVLDQLEGVHLPSWRGPGYRRARRIVRPFGARPLVAWVYLGDERTVADRPPLRADWKTHRRLRRRGG